MGQWGHFSDDGSEYIVTKPDTPRPWINYLTNGNYCALCSHTGGGYSFVGDPGHNRITREHPGDEIFEDRPGRYIYVHEVGTSKIWSLNWQPVMAPLQDFHAHVGLGYTSIEAQTNNLASKTTYFVPKDDDIEIWSVNLHNVSKKKRHLRIYTYTELTLGDFKSDIDDRSFVNLFNKTWFNDNILYATKTRWTNPEGHIRPWNKTAFLTLNIPVDGYETMREQFLGEYHYLEKPAMVEKGVIPHHVEDSADTVGVLCADIHLDAGEEMDFDVLLGAVAHPDHADSLRKKYSTRAAVCKALDKVYAYWAKYNDHFVIKTPDHEFNTSVNIWNRYQCWVTTQWSEMDSYYIAGSGIYGFRDEAQHIFGVLPHEPEVVKQKIYDLLVHQFKSGMTVHYWDTYSKKGGVTYHSDDPQWLVMAILNYVKETGDLNYLKEVVPYYDHGSGTIFEHLQCALDYTLLHFSKRGLPLRMTADWNDAWAGSKEGKGESTMVAGQVAWNIKELLPILEVLGKHDLHSRYNKIYGDIFEAINKEMWDGRWYSRGTTNNGDLIGSHHNSEGMIFLNAQSWPIIAGLADHDINNSSGTHHLSFARGVEAMDSVWTKLMTAYGPAIMLPPYTKKNLDLGVIAQFTPGTKENGTIFLHPVSWAVIAECILGRGDKAYEIWERSSFITRGKDPHYKSEPYVYPEYMYGPAHPKFGQGSYTWITGSAAWFYRACTDWIVGIKPTFDGLLLDPCVPKKWTEWSAERDFRGSRYVIKFSNPHHLHHGIKKMTVDGKEIAGNLLPDFHDAKTHNIEVVLEK